MQARPGARTPPGLGWHGTGRRWQPQLLGVALQVPVHGGGVRLDASIPGLPERGLWLLALRLFLLTVWLIKSFLETIMEIACMVISGW